MIKKIALTIRYGLLLFFALMSSSLSAQQALDSCLQQSLQHPSLEAARLKVQAGEARAGSRGFLPDPQVSLGYFLLPVETRTGAQTLRASLRQSLTWFGRLKAERKAAEAQVPVAQQQLREKAALLLRDVRKQYASLFLWQEELQILSTQISLLKKQETLVLQAYEAGKRPMVDLLQLRTEIRSAETDFSLLEGKKNPLGAAFAELLAAEGSFLPSLPDSLPFPLWVDSLSFDAHPAFARMQAEQNALQQQDALLHKKQKPTLMLGMDYILISPNSGLTQSGQDAWMASAGLRLPLKSRSFKLQHQAYALEQERIEQDKKSLNGKLMAHLAALRQLFEEAKAHYLLAAEQKKDLNQLYRLSTEAYSAGGMSFERLLNLQRQLLENDLMRARARVKAYLLLADLYWISGKDIQQLMP